MTPMHGCWIGILICWMKSGWESEMREGNGRPDPGEAFDPGEACADPIGNALFRDQRTLIHNQSDPCFAAGTLVLTREGDKPIEQVQVGDWVLTYPDDRPPPEEMRREEDYIWRQVTRTFIHEDELLSHVKVLSTSSGHEETYRVTANHPFYIDKRGWIPVSQLSWGAALTNSVFGNTLLIGIQHGVERARVYNIEVDECHTYYVGKIGVWVHNKGNAPTVISDLRPLQNPISIFNSPSWRNFDRIDSNANTGRISEFLGVRSRGRRSRGQVSNSTP
jgi:Pretoxin HINT domain